MATWTDGPEYAPVERPDVFVAPDAVPLAPAPSNAAPPDAAPSPSPSWGPPHLEPPAFEDAAQAIPLADLAPPVAVRRDPREAFDVVATPLTTWHSATTPTAPPATPAAPPPLAPVSSAWGAAHAPTYPTHGPEAGWGPEQPFPAATLPPPTHYPAPGRDWPPPQVNPADFPPPDGAPWQPPAPSGPQPVSLDRVIAGVTPGVLIALAVGLVVGTLSGVMYFVAWVLASRVKYRKALVARMFSIGAFAMLGIGFVAMVLDYGAFDVVVWYEASMVWAQLANLVLAVASILVVRNAIVRGEPPEPNSGH